VIGSHLATPAKAPTSFDASPLDEQMITRLEMQIDSAETDLPPLRNFVPAAGTETSPGCT